MKKIFVCALALLTCLTFSACSDDLNIEKLGNLGSTDDFYKTDNDAEQAITACYTDLGTIFEPIKAIDDLLSDDVWCGGGNRNDNAQRETIGDYTFGSTNELIQQTYEGLYTMIYHANLMLQKFERYDTPVKKRDQAEAYFFRGLAHFYLGAYFGTAPVVDHLLEPSEYAKTNSTREQLYTQAAADLKAAIGSESLSRKTALDTKLARISKEAAQAFLGKVLVFAENYTEAAQNLNEVINSGLYRLNTTMPYENLLHAGADFDAEHVLEWNAVADYANYTQILSLYYIYRGFRGEFFNWNATDSQITNVSNSSYGFFNPTEDLYNAFVKEEGTDGYRLNQSIKTVRQIADMGITLALGKTLHGNEGYFNWKQRMLNTDFIIFGLFPTVNRLWMSYAEVLLLAAEANLQAGDKPEALKALNAIRQRAKLPVKTDLTMDDIKTEKRLELWGLGTRWMDLVRWGDAAGRLNGKGKEMPGFNGRKIVEYANPDAGFKSDKNEMLPIPDQEIKLNKNMKQNKGY
ncbi:RagB/SusD family nutrient uptake outer membrane protein [Prevotella sp. A2931]|uniref:RagB/SusD family nutrient uptake outer membrane protein n=1 Tax=Prevotella illustrans TaxID=2800387 RepID=A0ABS3M3V9_9BACT|nr:MULTISPECIES: RagB/SusD family nutrient uptake outer membrane protein [Prevotella]MBO1362868.1 RagB/SusD family nutrient uptake outer membrane protein [Prevotella illustrans]PTL25933.1 RagB/SusD family nutrient uptake outer membrane protein [Prevotella sp. oral taxon 820]